MSPVRTVLDFESDLDIESNQLDLANLPLGAEDFGGDEYSSSEDGEPDHAVFAFNSGI